MNKEFDVTVVIPLFNEEKNLPTLAKRLHDLQTLIPVSLDFLFVDDGSTDLTAVILKQLASLHSNFKLIILSRNFGHQYAVSAGLLYAKGKEAIFVIDGDLQDPPELLIKFYESFKLGYDVVYGIRKNRKENTFLKLSYKIFYILLQKISNIHIPLDSGDFCLMSRRVVDLLNSMPEESRFLRGLRSWVGFNQLGISYDRDLRFAGTSKYSLFKLINLALDGIFNFTKLPTRLIFILGFISMIFSMGYLFYSLIMKIVFDTNPVGFTGLLFIIVFLSSIQMISISILGEYTIRIFFQSKARPLYVIKEIID